MNQELTQHSTAPPRPPARLTRAETDTLALYRSRTLRLPDEAHWSIAESDKPTGQHLAMLQERRNTLAAMPLTSHGARKLAISRLFMRFPQGMRADPEAAECYAEDLAPYPAWAISGGLADIISGFALRSPEFLPTSLQVRAAVEARMQPARDDIAALSRVLDAKVVPDEVMRPAIDVRRNKAQWARDLIRQGAAPPDPPREPHPLLPSTFDAAKARPTPDAPSISEELRKHVRTGMDLP